MGAFKFAIGPVIEMTMVHATIHEIAIVEQIAGVTEPSCCFTFCIEKLARGQTMRSKLGFNQNVQKIIVIGRQFSWKIVKISRN